MPKPFLITIQNQKITLALTITPLAVPPSTKPPTPQNVSATDRYTFPT